MNIYCSEDSHKIRAKNKNKIGTVFRISGTTSDQEFETFWPLAKFYHNCYTLGLQILYSCQYISHEHEYIFFFYCTVVEAGRGFLVVEGDCFRRLKWLSDLDRVNAIDLSSQCSYLISLKSPLSCSADKELNCKHSSSSFCLISCIWSHVIY